MEPLVSIIVPAYNAEKTIGRCITSVLDQTYTNIELIVVNDGSKDSTKEICDSFLQSQRMKLVNKENAGVSAARNTGLEQSLGQYILFLDADDTLPPNACTVYVAAMEKSVDLCVADSSWVKNNQLQQKTTIGSALKCGTYERNAFQKVFGTLYKNNYSNSVWGKCYRKEKIKEFFQTGISVGEDLVFNLAYLCGCERITILEDVLYHYYLQDNGSLSSSFRMENFDMVQYVYQKTLLCCQQMGMDDLLLFVDEKYVLDMITMFERYARSKNSWNIIRNMSQIYRRKELGVIFDRTTVTAGRKIRFEKVLLTNKWFGLFFLVARGTLCVKKLVYCFVKI